MNENVLVRQLRATLPLVFKRSQVEDLTGGMVKAKTLANLDSLGKGPERFRLGKLVAYEREAFLAWLERRMIN